MPSSTPIDVTEIMRDIRDRVRQKTAVAPPLEFPDVNLPLWTALNSARAGLSDLKTSTEHMYQLPPQPPTVRGSIGASLSRLLRRLLFWQYAQARTVCSSIVQSIQQLIATSEAIASQNEQTHAAFRGVTSKIKHLTEKIEHLTESSERIQTSEQSVTETMQRLKEHTEHISKENERLRTDLDSATQRITELSNIVAVVTEQVNSNNQSTQATAVAHSQESKKLMEQVAAMDRYAIRTRRDLVLQAQRISSILSSVRKRHNTGADTATADTTSAPDSMAGLYLALEDAFRGSPAEIAERVTDYLPILEQAGLKRETDLIVDIGCGRGEWLRVLSKNGYSNKGCDSNESMIQACREQGLNVEQQDALEFLRSFGDNSVSAVTAFHVIEHLSLPVMLALIDESLRTLHPGGLLILETPNPQNVLVASHNFYIDPTHQKPVPMILLQFLVEERGFCDIRPLPLHAYPGSALVENSSEVAQRFNEYFYGPQDYAIVAAKP
jgi:O-antigen chain-terminating methyltransferase